MILRIFYSAFEDPQWLSDDWGMLFAVLSAISMTVGNVVAIAQTNIKRMLGYSSIAQAGYLMVGLAAVTKLDGDIANYGPTGIVFFMTAYALANLGVFFAVIAITNKIDSDKISEFSGMGRRAPLVSLALTLCLISLTGFPPAAGFLAKFYVFSAAVRQGLVSLVIIGVLASLVSVFYYLRIIIYMYMKEPSYEVDIHFENPSLFLALFLCLYGVLQLGIFPGNILVLIRQAVAAIPLF